MSPNLDSIPLPANPMEVPVFITKVISVDKICFRMINNMEDYVTTIKGVQRYYSTKSDVTYISNADLKNAESLKRSLYILKRENVYYRVKVVDAWPSNVFNVYLLDEGFSCIANETELIKNDNLELQNKPPQAFVFPLNIDRSYDKKLDYIINYGLQKVVNSKQNFFASLSTDNQITLFYMDKNTHALVSINDYLVGFLKNQKKNDKIVDSVAVDADLSEVITNAPVDKTKPPKTALHSETLSRFAIPDEKAFQMKCKHVFNPSDFYLKLKKDGEFNKFVDELNEFYVQNDPKVANPILVNHLFITNYKDKWTRLYILGVVSPRYYSCLLFDKGIVGTICEEDIFDVDDRFKKMPPRSVKSCMAFVKPPAERWTREGNDFFKEQMKVSELTVYPINLGPDGVFFCSVTRNGENIADLLHQRGYALIDI